MSDPHGWDAQNAQIRANQQAAWERSQEQLAAGGAAYHQQQQTTMPGQQTWPQRPWRRRWIRGTIAVVVAVVALIELPVELVEGHDGAAGGAAVVLILFGLAARRFLHRPR